MKKQSKGQNQNRSHHDAHDIPSHYAVLCEGKCSVKEIRSRYHPFIYVILKILLVGPGEISKRLHQQNIIQGVETPTGKPETI